MTSIAFATYSAHPTIEPDDQLLADRLIINGIKVTGVPWDQPGIDWSQFDLVLVRSTWDYHHRLTDYLDWIHHLKFNHVNLVNSPTLIEWNLNKRYLFELAKKGIKIIPSIEVSSSQEAREKAIQNHWSDIVIKPLVGASGEKVIHKQLNTPLSFFKVNQPSLIQPFIPEVVTKGELSLIFLNSRFSHAALKKPGLADFRTQPHYGGSEESVSIDNTIINTATQIINSLPTLALYARVDGVIINDQFTLMELELTEPYLFFSFAPHQSLIDFSQDIIRLV